MVREAFTVLDLDVKIYPCPKGGPRYREAIKQRGGKYQFPYFIDPNTRVEMYESGDINRYLFKQYGTGSVPVMLSAAPLTMITASLASLTRSGQGVFYRKSNPPDQLLELYSYEGSPFCRLVRETLSELEIPYLLHNIAQGSPRREAFVARSGKMMVPYLVDPNTQTAMFESADIVAYLQQTYVVD